MSKQFNHVNYIVNESNNINIVQDSISIVDFEV